VNGNNGCCCRLRTFCSAASRLTSLSHCRLIEPFVRKRTLQTLRRTSSTRPLRT